MDLGFLWEKAAPDALPLVGGVKSRAWGISWAGLTLQELWAGKPHSWCLEPARKVGLHFWEPAWGWFSHMGSAGPGVLVVLSGLTPCPISSCLDHL